MTRKELEVHIAVKKLIESLPVSPELETQFAEETLLELNNLIIKHKRKQRKKTTGRFDTREELEKEVWFLYHYSNCTQTRIAQNCRVSPSVVGVILNKQPYRKKEDCF